MELLGLPWRWRDDRSLPAGVRVAIVEEEFQGWRERELIDAIVAPFPHSLADREATERAEVARLKLEVADDLHVVSYGSQVDRKLTLVVLDQHVGTLLNHQSEELDVSVPGALVRHSPSRPIHEVGVRPAQQKTLRLLQPFT